MDELLMKVMKTVTQIVPNSLPAYIKSTEWETCPSQPDTQTQQTITGTW